MERFGTDYCYLAEGDDEALAAQLVRIETRDLASRSGDVQVVTGLKPGARVVTTAVEQLRDGQAIRLDGSQGLASRLKRPQTDTTP